MHKTSNVSIFSGHPALSVSISGFTKELQNATALKRCRLFIIVINIKLRFADDQAMVAKSQKGLQAMMDRLDRTSREYGMKINIKKTKVLKISKGKETMVR